MSEDKYILIRCDEDGGKCFEVFTQKEIQEDLDEFIEEGGSIEEFYNEPRLKKAGTDMGYYQGYILIKGEIVVPKIEKEVTKVRI